MSQPPSRYRREGRNAYVHGMLPADLCPYKIGAIWSSEYHRKDWLEGWEQAKQAYVEPEEYHGYLYALREQFTDEEINDMTNI